MYLRVVVSYTDGHGADRSSLTSSPTAAVRDVDDTGSIAALASPVQGTALTVPVITDADGDVAATGWLWQTSPDPTAQTPSWTDVGTDRSYTPGEADVGRYIRLIVTYTDGHGPGKMVTTAPSAQITDANDKAPVFTHTAPDALPEGVEVEKGTRLYQAVVTPDVSDDEITYSLEGADAGLFNIGARGVVRFNRDTTPDFETNKDGYSFTVVATTRENAADEQVARQEVIIAIEDVDEIPTAISLRTVTDRIYEGLTVARKLADVIFTDDALGTNAAVIRRGNTDLFELREDGTELWLKGGVLLDYETAADRVHTIRLAASTAPLQRVDFTLRVDNVNDTPPVFTSAERVTGPRDGTIVTDSQVLYTAVATGDTGTVRYSLPDDVFYLIEPGFRSYAVQQLLLKIDPVTGEVSINGDITDESFDEMMDQIHGEDDYDLIDWTSGLIRNSKTNKQEWHVTPTTDGYFSEFAWLVVEATVTHATGVQTQRQRVDLHIANVNNIPPDVGLVQVRTLSDDILYTDEVMARLVVNNVLEIQGFDLSFVLSGTDASLFIVDDRGVIRFKNMHITDFEAQPSYSFTVTARVHHFRENLSLTASEEVTLTVRNNHTEQLAAFVDVPYQVPLPKSQIVGMSYQWQRSADISVQEPVWTHITGATTSVYTPAATDAGMYLRAIIMPSTTTSFISAVSQPVASVTFQYSPPDPFWETRTFRTSDSVYQAVVVNTHPGAVVWGLTGQDAEYFNISTTGRVTFKQTTVLDYEGIRTSRTGGLDGYSFTVTFTVAGQIFSQDVEIGIRNVDIEGTHGRSAQNFNTETLTGTAADEIIFGLDGADTIDGGAGDDILFGARGPDAFVLNLADGLRGQDIVTDFHPYARAAANRDLHYWYYLPETEQPEPHGIDLIRVKLDWMPSMSMDDVQDALNIRWVQTRDAGRGKSEVVSNQNNPHLHDTIIYYTHGTADTADDQIVMVLEDFNATLTTEMFEFI